MNRTPDLVITIPIELTQSLIIRRSAVVFGEENALGAIEALKLAIELHQVIGEFVKLRLADQRRLTECSGYPDEAPFPLGEMRGPNALEVADFTLTAWLNILGGQVSPRDDEWIADELVGLVPHDLYLRWLEIGDAVTGTNSAASYRAMVETCQ
jgi:hypothetical protein